MDKKSVFSTTAELHQQTKLTSCLSTWKYVDGNFY
jgi:hypothetical protein